MPCSVCYCMSGGFFNILCLSWYQIYSLDEWILLRTLASCDCGINGGIYFHSYLCCQHIIFAISLNLIRCLHNAFYVLGKQILSQLLVQLMYIFHIWINFSHCKIYLFYSISWYIIPSYSSLHYAGLISSRLGSCLLPRIFSQMKCRKTEHIMQK